jgi:hypothetical protein
MFRFVLPALMAALLVCGCASAPVNTLPDPEPTAKLRVMVLAVTGPRTRGYWAVSEEDFARKSYAVVGRFLRETGIYEVIPGSDLEKAAGKKKFAAWEWKQSDWSLAREVGRAVHADYIFIAEREDSGLLYYRMIFINRETGRQYAAGGNAARQQDWTRTTAEANAIIRESYREIFHAAKSDLFETALRRGRTMRDQPAAVKPVPDKPAPAAVPGVREPAPVEIAKAAPEKKSRQAKKKPVRKKEKPAKAAPVADAAQDPGQPVPDKPAPAAVPEAKPDRKTEEPVAIAAAPAPKKTETPARSKTPVKAKKELTDVKVRLIVYDFNAAKHMEVVSLILADALREELFNIGPFVLVNRENVAQAVDELKLQYSGLVDEKQAVRVGDWLAANEMVTGRLSALGQTYVLSATRTDIGTLRALGMGSLKCPVGKEEDLLTGIPEIARKLAGPR